MTFEILHKLCSPEIVSSIEANLERSPESIALDKHIAEAALVATQVKYLQRAKTKLPSYYAARCILSPLGYEQSSSEAMAATKKIEGESALDLTCGLGVDTLYLAKRFNRVVTIERNELFAAIARENFRRLGANNITVVNSSAEEYIASCPDNSFDWIYADPDRRGSSGEKLVKLEDCSPNVLALKGEFARVAAGRVMIKNSPLFDIDEAFRLFSPATVEALSLADECKELLITTSTEEDKLIATALNKGSLSVARSQIEEPPLPQFAAEEYHYLVVPDVALQKCRLVRYALSNEADIWSNNGFGFARTLPQSTLCRHFEIDRIVEYSPKLLRREFAGSTVEILKRDFPYSVTQITKQLKIKEGGARRAAFTRIGTRSIVILLK